MKIIYEFDTDQEDFDYEELRRIQMATEMCSCIWDIEQKMREYWKYDNRGEVPIDEFTEAVYDIIRDHNINTDKMWS